MASIPQKVEELENIKTGNFVVSDKFTLKACDIKQQGKVVSVYIKLQANDTISSLTSAGNITGVDKPSTERSIAIGLGNTEWQINATAYAYLTKGAYISINNLTNTSQKYFHINFTYIAD